VRGQQWTFSRFVSSGVALTPLPPYSPARDPAEWWFEAIRASMADEVYADLDATCARLDAILAHWDAYPQQMQALVGWQWSRDVLEQLPTATTP
jgi:hypothetical protein